MNGNFSEVYEKLWNRNINGLTIQTFNDSPNKRPELSQIFAYDKERVDALNEAGAGIFFCPNPQVDLSKRSIENTSHFQCISFDIDVCKEKDALSEEEITQKKDGVIERLQDLEIKPNIVLHTKNGIQPIWVFRNPKLLEMASERIEANEQYKRFVKGFTQKTGLPSEGDNISRVIRLPNTKHLKNPNDPFIVKAYLIDTPQVTIEKFAEIYSLDLKITHENKKERLRTIFQEGSTEGSRNVDMAAVIGSLLASYPEDKWETICYSLMESHNQFRNSPPLSEKELRAIFESISKRQRKSIKNYKLNLTSYNRNTNQKEGLIKINGRELSNMEEEKIPYLQVFDQDGYLVEGWSHIIAAFPKVGKTEFIVNLIKDWVNKGYEVVYFSEEPKAIWRKRLSNSECDWSNFTLYLALGIDPSLLIDELSNYSNVIIVVDTLRNLLGLENENDNSEVARVLNPWISKTREINSTLIGIHHTRKGGGKYGEGIAGGHALLGAVDVALEINRVDNQPSRRLITGLGRLISVDDLIYERDDEGRFNALGSPEALLRDEVILRIKDIIVGREWKTTKEIEDSFSDPKPSSEQLRKALNDAAEKGIIFRDPPFSEGKQPGKTYKWCTLPPQEELLGGSTVLKTVEEDS